MKITKHNFDQTVKATLDSGEFEGTTYYFDEHKGGIFTVSRFETILKQFDSEYKAREYFLYCIGIRSEQQATEEGVI